MSTSTLLFIALAFGIAFILTIAGLAAIALRVVDRTSRRIEETRKDMIE